MWVNQLFHAWLSIGLSLQQLHFDTNCSNVWPERFHVPSSNPRSQDQVTFFSALLPKSASILYYFLNLSSAAPTRFLVFVFNVLVDPKLDPSKHSLGIAEAQAQAYWHHSSEHIAKLHINTVLNSLCTINWPHIFSQITYALSHLNSCHIGTHLTSCLTTRLELM